ncbi:glycerophosphoryl diester phosphodiesterase [Myxococcaceae bacterium]|jgi:glycerophosphoryl diester phosphodiesterase|nr:glycerophosphoryl diester phosphodiesterase [Myxococcaceae bacterium]
MPHPYFSLSVPISIGHRGAAGELPENTLESFARGLADGASILETDLHPTRDGALVLFHDDDVARTTDGRGPISAMTLAEAKRLDAGYGFSAEQGFPWRGKGLRVPTLEEALDRFPGVRFNIEIKETAPGVIDRTLATLSEKGRSELTLLAAEKDAIMASIRETAARAASGVAIGACVGEVVRCIQAARDHTAPPPGVMALQIPAAFAGRPLATPELVSFAHRHGIQVHVWTVNDPAEMDALLDVGVDGLISDHPARVREVLRSRGVGVP